jgi:hypothetical protein
MKKADMRIMEIIMAATLLFIGWFEMNRPETTTTYLEHTVQTGECVWNIAEKYADRQVKPMNEFTWMISKENGLEGKHIIPGQVLTIPMVAPRPQ